MDYEKVVPDGADVEGLARAIATRYDELDQIGQYPSEPELIPIIRRYLSDASERIKELEANEKQLREALGEIRERAIVVVENKTFFMRGGDFAPLGAAIYKLGAVLAPNSETKIQMKDGGDQRRWIPCQPCDGTGEIGRKCPMCCGDGGCYDDALNSGEEKQDG